MPKASAVILAGGRSSRMGSNKALLEFNRRSIIEGQVEELRPFFKPLLIVSNRPEDYGHLGVKVIQDIFPGHGPLGGIHAGLLSSPTELALVIACDLPFFTAKLGLQMLSKIGSSDGLVLSKEGQLEPLCAIYSKGCLAVIEAYLKAGILRVPDFYRELNIKIQPVEDLELNYPPEQQLFNVNTPEELLRARSMLKNNTKS